MSQKESEWKEKIRQDYKGILHEEQILETIAYWEDIISEAIKIAVSSREKEIAEEVRGLYQDTTIHAAGGTYFEREDSERNETIDEVLQIINHK